MPDIARRPFIKSLVVLTAGFAAGCRVNQTERSQAELSAEARQELSSIVADLRATRRYMPGGTERAAFYMSDETPKEVPGYVIDAKFPSAHGLDTLHTEVVKTWTYFGRMNWDKQNPESDSLIYTQEELDQVPDDVLIKAVSLYSRYDSMKEKAEKAQIIQRVAGAAPSVENH